MLRAFSCGRISNSSNHEQSRTLPKCWRVERKVLIVFGIWRILLRLANAYRWQPLHCQLGYSSMLTKLGYLSMLQIGFCTVIYLALLLKYFPHRCHMLRLEFGALRVQIAVHVCAHILNIELYRNMRTLLTRQVYEYCIQIFVSCLKAACLFWKMWSPKLQLG